MSLASIKMHALVTAVAIALPGAAMAHNDVTDQTNKVAEAAQQLQSETNGLNNAVSDEARMADANANEALDGDMDRDHDDDGDEGKLGLLGLLGLAGLLGLRRREPNLHEHRDTTTRETRTDRDGRI